MGCEHSLTAVRPPNVPELHVAILEGGREGEVVPDAELDITHTLRLACERRLVEGEGWGWGTGWPTGAPGGRASSQGGFLGMDVGWCCTPARGPD